MHILKRPASIRVPFVFLWVLFGTGAAPAAQEDLIDNHHRWQLLSYSRIPANEVDFSDDEMVISVNSSASPVIYPLKTPALLTQISVELSVEGVLNKTEKLQGGKGADDFLFRLGVVYEGDQTLGFFQRTLAADWVKKLFSLAPKGTGVSHIAFHNLYSDSRLMDQSRVHPASHLLTEDFVAPSGKYPLTFTITPEPQKKVLALWISSDGDDTQSRYKVRLKDFVVQL